jgi:hypothetical protein
MTVRVRTLRSLAGTLAAVLACLLAVEGLARYVIPKVSKVESRVHAESDAAHRIDDAATGARTVLLVGNSLLEAAVRPSELELAMRQSNWSPKRFVIEATTYVDWYYGLRRQFESGRRPTAALLMLSAKQFAATEVRGTYSAYHLLGPGDALEVGHRVGMHPTQTVGLVIGSLSAYYGLRTELRQFFLRKSIPGVDQVAAVVAGQARAARPGESVTAPEGLLNQRLDELKALCDRHQVRCLLSLATEMDAVPWTSRLVNLSGWKSATSYGCVG